MAAPNHVDHQPAAGASSSASPKPAGGHNNPIESPDDRDPTRLLVQMLAGTALGGMPMAAPNHQVDQSQAAAAPAALRVFESPPVRASPDDTPAAGSRAERRMRRRTRLRFRLVPADYLRAGQESRDRSRRRELVSRCVGKLLSVHEDRARERGISAMMARLTTPSGAEGSDAAVSAAAPSPEHAGLADLLEKMALSKKH